MNYVKENTRKDYFLIEEFVEGEEFGAQAFVYNGEVQFILPHGDYVFHGDTGVPIGHFAPYNLNEDVIEDAKEQLRGAVKAMQLDNCAINADFILKDNKTYVLELGGRCGATCLAELTSIYYGFDYYEKILRTALGENPHFTFDKPFVPNASHLLMSDKDGIIKSQVDIMSQMKTFVKLNLTTNQGMRYINSMWDHIVLVILLLREKLWRMPRSCCLKQWIRWKSQ